MPVPSLFRRAARIRRTQDHDAVVITGRDELIAAAQVASSFPGPVRVRIRDVDGLRALALAGARPTTRDLRIRIDSWTPPVARWRGRHGDIRHLKSITFDYDPGRHHASCHVTMFEHVSVAEVVAALIPAFAPVAAFSGAGFPRLSIDSSAGPAALALLPTRGVPLLKPIAPHLAGQHLRKTDVLLTGTVEAARDEEDAFLQLTTGEAIVGSPRDERGVIDLNVHNPIGRLQGFAPSPPARRLRFDPFAGTAVIEPFGRGSARFRWEHPDAPAPAPITIDLATPIPASTVAELRPVEQIDLSTVDAMPVGLGARLVEIAATGVIVHSLPDHLVLDERSVSAELAELFREPYQGTRGLERERRAVQTRRAAMRDHGGFFRLASSISDRTGQRFLPRVSAIISTMRPDFIAGVVSAMAEQTYPELEIVVVAHGVPAPDLSGIDLHGRELQVLEVPSSVPFGAALAEGVRRSTGDSVIKLDDDDWYSENVIFDLVLAKLYSNADVVGKTTEYLYFEEVDQTVHRVFTTECYHDQIAGGAMMLSRSVLDEIGGWRPTPNSTDRSVLIGVEIQGGVAYRTQSLGYMYIRRPAKHTWQRTNSQLLFGSFEQWRGWETPEVV